MSDNFPTAWKDFKKFSAIPTRRLVFTCKEDDKSFQVLKSYGWGNDPVLSMDGSDIIITSKAEFPQFGILIETDVAVLTWDWEDNNVIRITPAYGVNGYITVWITVET